MGLQNGRMTRKLVRVAPSQQLAGISTEPLHFPQWQARIAGILGKQKVAATQGTFVLKRGCCRQGYQVESRRLLRGVCRRLEEPRPEPGIDLNPVNPSHGTRPETRIEESGSVG